MHRNGNTPHGLSTATVHPDQYGTASQSHDLANHKYSQFCHQTTRKLTDDDDDDDTVTALLHSAIDDAETIKKVHTISN